jgi:hypothetical protein
MINFVTNIIVNRRVPDQNSATVPLVQVLGACSSGTTTAAAAAA